MHLWINDPGYGDTTPNPSCGGTPADVTTLLTGAVFDYTAGQLTHKDTTRGDGLLPYLTKITSRPGLGGSFVENDQ